MLLYDLDTDTGLIISGTNVIRNCIMNIVNTLYNTKPFDTMGSNLEYQLQEPVSDHDATVMTVTLINTLKNELPGVALNEINTRAVADYTLPGYVFNIVLEVDGQVQEMSVNLIQQQSE